MKFVTALAFALLAAQPVLGEEAKPSDASIKQLLETMHSKGVVDSYMTQVQSTVRDSMQQAGAGQQLNAKQQKILDDFQTKVFDMVKQELNWADLEPTIFEVYRKSFNQSEVDGMLKFYRSPVGQSVIQKMPMVTQQTMASVQGRMKTITPKVVQLEKDTAAQVRAAADPQTAPAAPPPK
jgi:uncharacterized protein